VLEQYLAVKNEQVECFNSTAPNMEKKKTLKNKKPRRGAKLLLSGCIYLASFSTGLNPAQEKSACRYSGIKLYRIAAAYLKEGITTSTPI
jgi:hypothetical protein